MRGVPINSQLNSLSASSDLFAYGGGAGIPLRELLLVGLIAVTIAYFSTILLTKLAIKFRIFPELRERDLHAVPIPRIGGIGIYCGVLAGIFMARKLPALARGFIYSSEILAVLVAGGIILVVGLVDDIWGLDAATKLIGQTTAACVLAIMGVGWWVIYFPFFNVGTIVLDPLQSACLAILVVVTTVNAVNFIDGLDGLAAGLGCIIALAISVFSVGLLHHKSGDVSYYPPAVIGIIIAGACLGFLPHNFFPARIFMGDCGAMLIGLIVATAFTSVSGRVSASAHGFSNKFLLTSPLLLVAAITLIPMTDLVWAIVRRTRAGLSPFTNDNKHLHHRLLYLGHNHRKVVLLIYCWAGIPSMSMALSSFIRFRYILPFTFILLGVVIWFTFSPRLFQVNSNTN